MSKEFRYFPSILFAGGLFYFSLVFFTLPAIMMTIIFISFSVIYVLTGSVRLALFSPVVFLIGVVTGLKPFIDKEKGVLVLTHKDYILDTDSQRKKQIFNILILG